VPGRGIAASDPDHDAARRAFFREFGRQAVTTVGQIAGVADMVNRASGSAAAGLLGLSGPASAGPGRRLIRPGGVTTLTVASASDATATDDAYRSPYRMADDELVLLDQRGLPEHLVEVSARRGSDVAYFLRQGVCRGGPLLAQVAAYGLALTASERVAQPPEARDLELRRTARALSEARPSARLPIWAMQRLGRCQAELGEAAEGGTVAAALRAEADAIAAELQVAQAAIASALAELLAGPVDHALGVLVHGNPGALSGGLVGTGITALRQLREQGRRLRVFVTETRPFMDGARLASWELRQAGIGHKVIPDAAAAWLFEQEAIDAVLMAGEWIAADGATGAVIGSRAIAQQAAAAARVAVRPAPRVIVSAPTAAIDPSTPDGAAIPVELRPARELASYLVAVPIRAADALVPAGDVIPAAAIAALVTERGVLAPPTAEAIAALLGAAPGLHGATPAETD
jgi:methylthioribose-1-phosphate isomerase